MTQLLYLPGNSEEDKEEHVRIDGVPVEIRTRYVPYISEKCDCKLLSLKEPGVVIRQI
jgi:hypothetical protein